MLLNLATTLVAVPFGQLITAFIFGLVPVLIWLWFLEKEDNHPEPKRLIIYAFLAGIIAVFCVIPIEDFISQSVTSQSAIFILWAVSEELVKFIAAYVIVLRRKENDEPIDSMMYLIATALGFAAMENAFFILRPIIADNTIQAIITADFRFIGASLLHVVASSVIGASLALAFYKSRSTKAVYLLGGIILSIILHAVFNLSIIREGGGALFAFYAIWTAVVIILLFFEKAKRIKKS